MLRRRRSPLPLAFFIPVVFCALSLGLLVLAGAAGAQDEHGAFPAPGGPGGDAQLGKYSYDDFEPSATCAECHVDIARQHEQAMMAQSYTHKWDEIEYFELAVPHAEKDPKVAGVKAGCNGCHAPLSFLAGEIPPPRPGEGSRADEGVSCDLCHVMVGFTGKTPYNFNYELAPGEVKRGNRAPGDSPFHDIATSEFLRTAEYCGTCHNEQSPYGVWVKATQLEWAQTPQGKAGIVCQDCHMPPAKGRSATIGQEYPDVRQHLFHGAHDEGKLAGVVEVRIHAENPDAKPGQAVGLTATLVNAKAGHPVPSGSAEERVLWVHVEAVGPDGKTYPLAVEPKGFEGEEYTIASDSALAYQDLGFIQDIEGFRGLKRDGEVPAGDRIFRLPYLDPDGQMTIAQWHTASFGPDYRLWPLEARNEDYTWTVPKGMPAGEARVTATVWYSRLVSSVAEHMGVPREESAPVEVSHHTTLVRIVE